MGRGGEIRPGAGGRGEGAVKELLGSPDAGDLLEEGLDAMGLTPDLLRREGSTP